MSQFILATGSYDSSIRLFDASNSHFLANIIFQDTIVLHLAFSHGTSPATSSDRLYLVAGGSPRVCVYDVDAALSAPHPSSMSRPHDPVFAFAGHTGAITDVGFDPVPSPAPPGAGVLGEPSYTFPAFGFSASEDGTLQVWDPLLASGGARLDATETLVRFVNFAPICAAVYDATRAVFFTADGKGRLRAWGRKSGKLICSVRPHAEYDFDFDDDHKETEAVNSGQATRERVHVDSESPPGNFVVNSELSPHELPGGVDDTLQPHLVTEKDIDRRGVMLQTLEMFKKGGVLCLVTADTQGGVFIYEVEAMLRDRYAKPYAAWNLLDKPYSIDSTRVYTLKTKVSMNGKVLCCTMSNGQVKVFDMHAVDRYVNVDLPRAQKEKAEEEAREKAAVDAEKAAYEKEADQFVAEREPLTPEESAQKKKDYVRRKMATSAISQRRIHIRKHPELVKETTVVVRKTVTGHSGFVWDAAFIGDENSAYYFFTCSSDMRLFLWHLDGDDPNRYPDHDKNIVCLAIKERTLC